jgi:hypothetical protein
MTHRHARLLLLCLALPACAERTAPDPTPLEDGGVYNMIDPVRIDDAAGAGLTTLGSWQTGTVAEAQAVLFAKPRAEPIFAIYCDGGRGLVLERRGLTPTGTIARMDVAIAGTRRALAVNPLTDSGPPVLRAIVPYNDELQVRLQDRAAPMSIDVGEGQPLRLPPSPLVPALAAECARGDS